MKTCFSIVFLMMFFVSNGMTAEEKIDPSGTWRWEYDWQGETRKDALRINLGKDGKVAGTYHGRTRVINIKDGKIEKDQLSFKFDVEGNGQSFELKFAGKVKGDEIDGTVGGDANGQVFEYPWKPKRSVQNEDIIGNWQFRMETGNGNTREPKMQISKDGDKLKAVYTSQTGREFDVSDLKVDKNNLTFTVKADFNGNALVATYKGRPYGDKISGKIDYDFNGNTGELEFTGKREDEKKDEKKENKEE